MYETCFHSPRIPQPRGVGWFSALSRSFTSVTAQPCLSPDFSAGRHRINTCGPVWCVASRFSTQPPAKGGLGRFTLTPMLTTVGDLLSEITAKDPGVQSASLLNGDGQRIHMHLHGNCQLHSKHTDLLVKQEELKKQLQPLETERVKMALEAESRATQLGNVYPWDVMEPITFFISLSTSMLFFAYYILTKQEFIYPHVKDRQFLHFFHYRASHQKFNVHKYNELKEELAKVDGDLSVLRSAIRRKPERTA
ncbi:hypothetical protein F7725_005032 [Dissostichus mawsoni]|uniref:Calcium uniporter protein n=1 Tax=Dissostichus mawsoni TaxID=36200 RepID=A0A7J5XN48_DISMA|nr:hypothetical protein F7725_005032 [Dissostichus mawsoni]